ncbi:MULTISPECIES: 5-histidylcysteine sulfoxide synthase [unclassified Methylophaga]|uniref:5-histidylcysteine sulfoxide synthase n=1 Tax=unclassified Methylophaga TaxID=2629249 RepID=UPI000C93EB28|nr:MULTISPECIES: 5-histidylcysteine sulfoxide synthase [unclassified Methylophaga]MBN45825.1 SAM-dependent methyltransferase [Methylophaga sp.]|tara:strand:+ start:23105 stop:25252 length:2148 start_codon:yes stop_codon:yes gene_type:complete
MTAEKALSFSHSEATYLRTPHLNTTDPAAVRTELAAYFNANFERYESLFDTLKSDDGYYQKSIPLRHPLIFYFGHTATFFVNKLLLAGLLTQRINPRFESMFAVGVDEMSWDDLNDAHYDWPTVAEVKAYRQQVKKTVNQLIQTAPLQLPINWENPWWAIMMGIEHEQIHLETSSVLIRQQQLQWVQPHAAWLACDISGPAPENALLQVEAGTVSLGKSFDDAYYGWDNEYGQHQADVEAFKAARYLVSNQEFLAFVEAGGYLQRHYWQEEGLQWREFTQAEYPTFWIKTNQGWQLRLMAEVVPMRWDWPAEVNYHEAKAFCAWKAEQTGETVRLPTEDEWYRLVEVSGLEELNETPAAANIHLDHFASSCPVNHFAQGDFYDVRGNVWQWTETPIYPFDGSQVHRLYDDFTTPTYDGKHNLMKGGSWVSCGNETRLSSRYAFRRHFFQHAGFRYVVSEAPVVNLDSNYETDKMLSEYAEFHYGESYFDVPNFQKAIARLAIEKMSGKPSRRALDLGCAVGRASFELARHFDQVTGIDFSARLINLGVQLKRDGVVRYAVADEGDLLLYREQRLANFGLEKTAHKVDFMQGDACNLKAVYSNYDLVLAANLLDRLYDPILFLKQIHERINAGGLLVLASPYTWLEEHTDKANWLGGFKKDGESFSTLDGIKSVLEKHFQLIDGPFSQPFVIRETRRKFQHTLSEVTIWERRHVED